MKEIELQSLIIKSVRQHGGSAHKLSSRFLVGVVDLLIKLPAVPAALFEVKLNKFSVKVPGTHIFKLDVTVPQNQFMKDYDQAGMKTGVISGIQRGTRLSLLILPLDTRVPVGYAATVGRHCDIGQANDRLAMIYNLIGGYLNDKSVGFR